MLSAKGLGLSILADPFWFRETVGFLGIRIDSNRDTVSRTTDYREVIEHYRVSHCKVRDFPLAR